MRILIDIGHPGHVHLFRPFAQKMLQKGHTILFTCRQKEFEIELLKSANFNFICFGKHYKSKIGKIWGLIKFNFQMLHSALKFKPDLLFSHGSIYAAQISWLIGKPHISLEDTGNNEQVNLYLPFTKVVLTSNVFYKNYGEKHLRYNGYHELAYLHPNHFKSDINIFNKLGISIGQVFFIVRFISWNASHDIGQNGLTLIEKKELIKLLSEHGKVIISAEGILPSEIEKYRYTLEPIEMHNCLNHAALFIGEGATMASECAVLGTPSIYINSLEAGSIDDQEKYGLLYHFRNGKGVIEKTKELLNDTELKNKCKSAYKKILDDKIDVTKFFVWFIENYPQSFKIMKENPDYQLNFK